MTKCIIFDNRAEMNSHHIGILELCKICLTISCNEELADISCIDSAIQIIEYLYRHRLISFHIFNDWDTWLPPLDAAVSDAVTVSSQEIRPLSIASITSSMVITFVTLAGGSFSWAFCS